MLLGEPVPQDTWSSGKHANWHCYRYRDSNPRTSWSPETRKRLGACPEHSCLPLRSGLERRKSGSPGWEAAICSFQAFWCHLLRTTKGEGLPDAARALPESAFKNAFFITYFLEEKIITCIEQTLHELKTKQHKYGHRGQHGCGQVLGGDIKRIWACTWPSLLPSLKTHCSSWRHPRTLTCLPFICLCITITYELCTRFCINE